MWILYFTLVISSAFSDNVTFSIDTTTYDTTTTTTISDVDLNDNVNETVTTVVIQDIVYLEEEENDDITIKWNSKDFPNPILMPEKCKRHSPSYICDPDHVLSDQEANRLNNMIIEYRNNSHCICKESCLQDGGMAIGIAILEHMFLPYSETMDEIGSAFAEDLYNQWNLGSCGDSIIIMVATKDKQSSTYLSENLKEYIPNELSQRIWNESRGHFLDNYYLQGLESMVESFYDVMKFIPAKSPQMESTNSKIIAGSTFLGLIIGFLVIFALAVIFSIFYYQRNALKSKDQVRTKPKPIPPGERKRSITVKGIHFPSTKYQSCSTADEEKYVEDVIVPAVIPRQLSAVPEETDDEEPHNNTSTFKPPIEQPAEVKNTESDVVPKTTES